jgi:hypothetical protein
MLVGFMYQHITRLEQRVATLEEQLRENSSKSPSSDSPSVPPKPGKRSKGKRGA